jgi:hypothetical protein
MTTSEPSSKPSVVVERDVSSTARLGISLFGARFLGRSSRMAFSVFNKSAEIWADFSKASISLVVVMELQSRRVKVEF